VKPKEQLQLPGEPFGDGKTLKPALLPSRVSRKACRPWLQHIGRLHRSTYENRLNALVDLARLLPVHRKEIEPWLRVEIADKAQTWAGDLEAALLNGHNAEILIKLLPLFYEVLDLPDRDTRTQLLSKRAIHLLVKDKQFASALAVLRDLPERQPAVEAACHEGLGDFRKAAESPTCR
jgi:hypothetical protein